MIERTHVGGDMREYLVEKTKGQVKVEVLFPRRIPKECVNPPSCELGLILVDIFGAHRWPSMG